MVQVSIVVPLYNVEKYIERCLKSIMEQTFDNYEVIIVNDGSKDNSINIAEKFQKRYPDKIRIITQKNAGLSAARNKGIQEAVGEYICFIDSDDFIKDDMIEKLYQQAVDKNADMVICGVNKYIESTKETYEDVREYDETRIFDSEHCIREFLLDKTVEGYACNKLFKRSLFLDNNIQYPVGKMFEDVETTIKLIIASDRIAFSDNYGYYYVQREGSITKDVKKRTIEDYIRSFVIVKQLLEKNNIFDNLKDAYKRYYINRLNVAYVMLYNYEFNNAVCKELRIKLKMLSKDVKLKDTSLPYVGRVDKMKTIFIKLSIFKLILSIKNKIYSMKERN